MTPLPNPILTLEKPPRTSWFEEHVWVDYIELLCLINIDKMVSRANILDRVTERSDLGELPVADFDLDEDVIENPEDSVSPDEVSGDNEEEPEFLEDNPAPAEVNDKWTTRAVDWFRHLEYRQGAFGDFYPFNVDIAGNVLSLEDELTPKHHLYLFLLLASHTGRLPSRLRSNFTSEFEFLSKEVVVNCLPEGAEVHIFGSSNGRTSDRYQGNIWHKICRLAQDTKETVRVREDAYARNSVGDQGLDIVGWIPTGDNVNGIPIIFAQCACTVSDWKTKQHSSSYDAWHNIIGFMSRPTNMTFIPMCFRRPSGEWHTVADIGSTVLVDRVRFLYLLGRKYEMIREMSSLEVIAAIIQEHEPLF